MASSSTKHPSVSIGRLPSPEVEWPIARLHFEKLIERWRPMKVWLSMWNREGLQVAMDAEAPRFWQMLWAKDAGFQEALGDVARRIMEADATRAKKSASSLLRLEPWQNAVGLMAAIVRWRQRVVGVVMGGVVTMTDEPGEAFVRRCCQCGLDSTAMAALARQAGCLAPDRVESLADMLRLTVDQARQVDVGREEAVVLTQNLENTYEELHLIYEISRHMRLPQRPGSVVKRVGQEVLEVSRARAIAFVLEKSNAEAPGDESQGDPETRREIVQVGDGAPDQSALDALAKYLRIQAGSAVGHQLHNDATRSPELQWAEPWLKHLVALPLQQDERLLGMMLALNCKDDGDYTSVDIQLLRAVADRVTAFLENQRLYDDLAELLSGLLHALVNSIDAKDPYTCGHSERVAYLSRALAKQVGLSDEQCERVYLAGLLHDVGKIGVPDAILCKPGTLTKDEFDALKKHPQIGGKILSHIRQVQDLLPGVLYHHERMDGRGYPDGLAGANIPLLGRIICLADCFDAMTTHRTYRSALPLPVAIAEIRRCSGTQFDPRLSEMFLGLDVEGLLADARRVTSLTPGLRDALSPNIGIRYPGGLNVANCNLQNLSMEPNARAVSQ